MIRLARRHQLDGVRAIDVQPLGLAVRTVLAAGVDALVPLSPSQRRSSRIARSDSRVERSKSVSSMRRMNVPPWPRASSQLKSAVRALPTCS